LYQSLKCDIKKTLRDNLLFFLKKVDVSDSICNENVLCDETYSLIKQFNHTICFMKVHKQPLVEEAGYDAGATIPYNFFRAELPKYLTPDLYPTGRRIIETCLNGGSVEDYLDIIPMDYQYSFMATSHDE